MSKIFGTTSNNLKSSLADFTQKISAIETEVVVSNDRFYTNLEAYTACRLIPSDKNTGPLG